MLLLPATRRDAEVTTALLKRERLLCVSCENAPALARALDGGVGAILMTDDALADPGIDQVLEALGCQPPWSDVPAIVLCGHDQLPKLASVAMRTLRNVTVLERPTTSRTLISAVKAAIRARAAVSNAGAVHDADGQRRRLAFTYPAGGGARHYDSLLIPEVGDSGAIETVLSVAHDATETQRSALVLEEANRRKDEFLDACNPGQTYSHRR